MINQDTTWVDGWLVADRFHDQSCAFLFVFEVRRVDQDESLMLGRNFEMFFKNTELIFGVFVEAYFADAQNIVFWKKFGDDLHDFPGEADILGLFGVDAKPSEMVDAVGPCSGRFDGSELVEIISKSFGGAPVVASPECRFSESTASGQRHFFVVVGGAAHHMRMGIDVTHQ